jgi:hypothetical protein
LIFDKTKPRRLGIRRGDGGPKYIILTSFKYLSQDTAHYANTQMADKAHRQGKKIYMFLCESHGQNIRNEVSIFSGEQKIHQGILVIF